MRLEKTLFSESSKKMPYLGIKLKEVLSPTQIFKFIASSVENIS